jgi:DNA-binding MarR family transcriptional regulator
MTVKQKEYLELIKHNPGITPREIRDRVSMYRRGLSGMSALGAVMKVVHALENQRLITIEYTDKGRQLFVSEQPTENPPSVEVKG